MPASADDPSEHDHLRDRNQQQRQQLDEVRQAGRVLERDGRVGVVEAASVHREVLDRLLGSNRPARDCLRRALQGRGRGVAAEYLRHALRDQNHGEDDADRQQDVDERAVEVDPEVPELAAGAAREPRTTAASTAIPTRRRRTSAPRSPPSETGTRAWTRRRRTASSCSSRSSLRCSTPGGADRLHAVRVLAEVRLSPKDDVEQAVPTAVKTSMVKP